MTKEQVKIAMGGNPTMTKGENVWVCVGKRASEGNPSSDFYSPTASFDPNRNFTETEDFRRLHTKVRTIIYFRGNLAVHAQLTEEKR